MWILPSYNRPWALRRLLEAPGGMPEMLVIVNEDDPSRAEYEATSPWPIEFCPAGSRLGGAYRFAYERHCDEPWYGMFGDDHIAQTPGWSDVLVQKAGSRFLAYPNGEHTEFPLMRGTCVVGGELAKQLGWIFAPGLIHNYCDCFLDTICRDAGLLKACPEVFVNHLHWKFCVGVAQDATYVRGSSDQGQDAGRYHSWMGSQERVELRNKLLGWKTTWD